ncbi:MAG: hypothetical protein VX949_03415 [Planctomycetota bacterium]|nr:hypothetical protein [Planctomycetota bacterium]
MKKYTFLLGLVSLLLVIPTVPAEGGTVFLKNGHVISGKVIASDDEKVILTWANGRATFYRRFISEVVLETSEKEYLARRLDAQPPLKTTAGITHIQLPELAELLPSASADVGPSTDDPSDAVELTQGDGSTELSEALESDVVEVATVDPELTVFRTAQLDGLGLALDVPEDWQSVSAKGAARISSEDGSILIALDRYRGTKLTPEVAANSLGDRLEEVGFAPSSTGRAWVLAPLRAAFIHESISPDQQKKCLHALVAANEGTLLVSIYTPAEVDPETETLISTIVSSLGSSIASR